MYPALVLLSIVLLVATTLPCLRSERWWIRALEFPRIQFAVLAVVLLLAELAFLDLSRPGSWLLLLSVAASLTWHLWWIAPYTALHQTEVDSVSAVDETRRIRLLSANVLGTNRQSEKFLELVRENAPDLVLTLESNAWWQTRLDSLEKEYPFTLKCPLENLYGMHVYSKLALEASSIEYLLSNDIPSMHANVKLRSGERIRVRFLHPAPPSPNEATDTRKRDAELLVVARDYRKTPSPTIVAGDLNDVAWSASTRLFRKISGLLDPRIGRGVFSTFHAGHWFLRWPLDHLFHSKEFRLCRLQRLENFGSDHFALLSELQYDPSHSGESGNSLDSDIADEKEAQRKTDQEKVDTTDVPEP
ncbi:endonuclease/exonuclease/phosphatase family protein [Dokdonella sp.]|uniref:endonuclease/exonuclease/phosphatase family protein n=1 Tax=Dokdonella sp. TaxID=2291710 RepID=UPI003C4D0293